MISSVEPPKPDGNQQPVNEGLAAVTLLAVLAAEFTRVSARNRRLEDTCVHKIDAERSRMRSLICNDIADALQCAATRLSANAGGMARELAAQDSDNPNNING